MAGKKTKSIDLTTNIGLLSFPRVFASTKGKKESTGEDQYDIQFLIPKTDVEGCRAIMKAIKEVGIDAFGDPGWKSQRNPFRNGDKERNNIAGDGQTNGEKYPERDGHYFLNARSTKPVGVYDRNKTLIDNPDDLRGGALGKIAVTFYAYNNNGNAGVGVSLNGVQKTGESGKTFGGSKPSVDSMFDLLPEEEDVDLEAEEEMEEPEPTPPPAKKAAAKKTVAKKAAAKKVEPEPEPEPEVDEEEAPEDDDSDLLGEDEADDTSDDPMYDDL